MAESVFLRPLFEAGEWDGVLSQNLLEKGREKLGGSAGEFVSLPSAFGSAEVL